MEIKGPLSDFNLGGNFFLILLWIHLLIQFDKQFSSIQIWKLPSAGFFICLIWQSIWAMQKPRFRILYGLNGNSILFSSNSLSFKYSSVCQFKFSFSFSLSSNKISFAKFTIRPYKLSISMLQTPNPSSKSISVQLTNIYLSTLKPKTSYPQNYTIKEKQVSYVID